MKKLFLCDIDGTIIDGSRDMKHISEKTKYAIKELSKDNYVFIASGRCKGLLEKQILDLGVNGYILCNGAYAEVDGKEIYAEYFDEHTAKAIMDYSIKNNGFYVMESLNGMYVNDLKAPQFIKFLQGWGKCIEGFENNTDIGNKYLIAMIGFSSEEDCLNCEKDMKDIALLARHNKFMSYDVNIKGIDKGYAAKKVMEYLGIDKQDSYCFGDGINDLEMLQAVGHPVMMANADERLKQYDFEVADDVLNDGFYHYLIDNKLIKPL